MHWAGGGHVFGIKKPGSQIGQRLDNGHPIVQSARGLQAGHFRTVQACIVLSVMDKPEWGDTNICILNSLWNVLVKEVVEVELTSCHYWLCTHNLLLYRCKWSEKYILLFLGIIKLKKTLTPEIHIIRKTEKKPVDCILLFWSKLCKMYLFRFANTFILVKNVNLQKKLHSKHHVREMVKVHNSHMDDQQNCADRNSAINFFQILILL